MVKRILIVDGTNHLNRLLHVSKPLYNSELIDVSIIYSFIKFIINIAFMENVSEIHIVFDVGRDIKKQKLYSEYKGNRNIKISNRAESLGLLPEELYSKLRISRNYLITFFNIIPDVYVYPILSVEGDTVIAYIAKKLLPQYISNNNKLYITIVSNDKDFYQLLKKRNTYNNDDNIYIDILRYYTKDNIYKHIDFEEAINDLEYIDEKDKDIYKELIDDLAKNIPYYKTILGDMSDNIYGIKGIGSVFISKLIKYQIKYKISGFNSLDDFIEFMNYIYKNERINDNRFKKQLKTVLNNTNILEVNYKLMDFEYAINYQIPDISIMEIKDIYINKKENYRYNVHKHKELIECIYKLELDSDEILFNDIMNFVNYMLKSNSNNIINNINNRGNIYINNWGSLYTLLNNVFEKKVRKLYE